MQRKQLILTQLPLKVIQRPTGWPCRQLNLRSALLGGRARRRSPRLSSVLSKFCSPDTHLFVPDTPQAMPETASFLGRRGAERRGIQSRMRKLPSGAGGSDHFHRTPTTRPEKARGGKIPQSREESGGRQGARVTILACQSNFILSFLSGTRTLHGAPCSEATGASLWPGSGSPRLPRSRLPYRLPPRATRPQRSAARERVSSPGALGARGCRLLPTAP